MKLTIKVLRVIAELLSATFILMSFWILGIHIGNLGAGKYQQYYFPIPGSLGQILFAVIELSLGIWFFIALKLKVLPGGMKELTPGEPTLAAKVKYIPGIFSLGVIAGLIGNAVAIFFQEAISYLK